MITFILLCGAALLWTFTCRALNRSHYRPLPGFEPIERESTFQPTPTAVELSLYPRRKGTSRSSKHWRKNKRDAARARMAQ